MTQTISIIIPCYNEESCLPQFFDALNSITAVLADYTFELIFVDDGSTDNTLGALEQLRLSDERVKYLSFSRNFGKEAAILAGLEHSEGELVAIMDADLQDPPELLISMLRGIVEENYDCVASRRATRTGEPPLRSLLARIFYKVINVLSSTRIVDGLRDFRLMTRQYVNSVLQLTEYNRFSKGMFSWIGYKVKYISFDNIERTTGRSKWSLGKLLLYSMDGITAFSTAPLAIATMLGLLFLFVSLGLLVYLSIAHVFSSNTPGPWYLMTCLLMLFSGIQLLSLGILGQYLAKTYTEIKNRPKYIVKYSSHGEYNDRRSGAR